jgi:hypothetical protein
MTHRGAPRIAVCTAAVCFMTIGPVASASASAGSIKAAIESYTPKILVAEGRVVTAVGEYKTSNDPTGVEKAIGESVAVLGALEAKVAHQSAGAPRVKLAKKKVVKGLQAVIVGYNDLSSAYAEKASSSEAATADATTAVALVKKGQKRLSEGVKLLS